MGKDLRGNGISRRNSQLNINGALNGAPTKRVTAKKPYIIKENQRR